MFSEIIERNFALTAVVREFIILTLGCMGRAEEVGCWEVSMPPDEDEEEVVMVGLPGALGAGPNS